MTTNPLSPNTTITTPSTPVTTTGKTLDEVENIWIQAGGNPQAAAMAAAVADASSGLNPGATRTNPDGTTSIGLWLIQKNGSPPGTTDPIANARAAIQLSNNGADWSNWCTAWSDNNCGCDGGTYLGEGSNALGSLAQRLTPASYNMYGAKPTGDGTSASATAPSATPTSSFNWKSLLIVVVIVAILFLYLRSKFGTQPTESPESQARSQHSWSPEEEAGLSDSSISDKELSASTGRSIRAIRVRRNQMKRR